MPQREEFYGTSPPEEFGEAPPSPDFISQMAAERPGSLFGLIERYRGLPFDEALANAGKEALFEHYGEWLPFALPILGTTFTRGNVPGILRRMANWADTGLASNLARNFMRAMYPRFSTQAPIQAFKELNDMPGVYSFTTLPTKNNTLGSVLIREAAEDLGDFYNQVAGIGEGMGKIRASRNIPDTVNLGATAQDYVKNVEAQIKAMEIASRKGTRMGELSRAAANKFISALKEQFPTTWKEVLLSTQRRPPE